MQSIIMEIRQRHAMIRGKPVIVCGNSGCPLRVITDAEWQDAEAPAVLIAYRRNRRTVCETVPVTDGSCLLPPVYETCEIAVSLTADRIRTAAPAHIPCVPAITDHSGSPHHPAPDLYNTLTELLSVQQAKDHFRYGIHTELGFLAHSFLAQFTHGELGKEGHAWM